MVLGDFEFADSGWFNSKGSPPQVVPLSVSSFQAWPIHQSSAVLPGPQPRCCPQVPRKDTSLWLYPEAFVFPMASGHINPSFAVARHLFKLGHQAIVLRTLLASAPAAVQLHLGLR